MTDQPTPLPPELELPGPSAEEAMRALRPLLASLLQRLPKEVGEALRLAAIPHWFDEELLQVLGGEGFPAGDALETLLRMHLLEAISPLSESPLLQIMSGEAQDADATPIEQPDYRLDPLHRSILLEEWHAEDLQGYLGHNRSAWEHFSERAKQAGEQMGNIGLLIQPALKRQDIYHRLAFDEEGGLLELAESFEEIFDRFQLGAAEELLRAVDDLSAYLSATALAWLHYFHTRLEVALHPEWPEEQITAVLTDMLARATNPGVYTGQPQPGEALSSLVLKSIQIPPEELLRDRSRMENVLRSLAVWTLGQEILRRGEWTDAHQAFNWSLKILQTYNIDYYIPRLMLSLGDTSYDLALKSGICTEGSWRQPSLAGRLFNLFANLPFLLVESLIRRLSFLPSGWYFGMNYQDWIVALLLGEAARWYRGAQDAFEAIGDASGLVRARLAMAAVELDEGRWSRAASTYRALQGHSLVQISLYRTALVEMGLGRLALAQGRLEQAIAHLEGSQGGFRRFKDTSSYAATGDYLGQANTRLGKLEHAVLAFLQSHEAFRESEDSLMTSKVTYELQKALPRLPVESELRKQVDQVIEEQSTLSYLARFPERHLPRFRRMALTRAVPITYLFVFLIGLALFQSFAVVETTILYGIEYQKSLPVSPIELLILLVGVFLPLPLFLWTYRLVYSVAGIWAVHRLGRDLTNIQEDQPNIIVTDPTGIEIRRARGEASRRSEPKGKAGRKELENHKEPSAPLTRLEWSQVSQVVSLQYRLWKQPISLISNLVLLNPGKPVTLEGSTLRFNQLKENILSKMGKHQALLDLDFYFVRSPWSYLGLAFSIAYAILLTAQGLQLTVGVVAETGGEPFFLTFSLVFLVSFLNIFFVYPAITLWRLIAHRRLRHKVIGRPAGAFPGWMLYLGAVGVSLVSLGWLVFVQLFGR